MAMPALSIVAREVIEAYGDDTNAHPVGTGPYMLKSWTRKAKIMLEANPDYRGFVWDFRRPDDPARRSGDQGDEGQEDAADRAHRDQRHRGGAVALARVPAREIDYIDRSGTFAPIAIPATSSARPRGARHLLGPQRRSRDHLLLLQHDATRSSAASRRRRSRCAARWHVLRHRGGDQGGPQGPGDRTMQMPDPAGRRRPRSRITAASSSTIPTPRTSCSTISATRRERTAGERCRDGKPLVILLASRAAGDPAASSTSCGRSRSTHRHAHGGHSSAVRRQHQGRRGLQAPDVGPAWIADYPDGDNFMQLLYGPNTGQSNNACYESKAFDAHVRKVAAACPIRRSATGCSSR